jgi:hypothetical protein
MDHADKKRMPVDETKIVDMLRSQGEFRKKMDEDIGTFSAHQNNPAFENGILTMLNEVATGEMRDLIRDVGINNDTITFYNTEDLQKKRDQLFTYPSDH